MTKFILYILVTILTTWAMDGLNINSIFKKGQIVKANVAYFLILLSIIYLVTNFIYDFLVYNVNLFCLFINFLLFLCFYVYNYIYTLKKEA